MSLYVVAALLAAIAFVLVGPLSVRLARASWVIRSPRAAVALWQSMGLSAALATIGAGLCVAVERFHAGFIGGLRALFDGVTSGRPLQGLGVPDALGLTLAADLGVVVFFVVLSVILRTARARAHHRRLLSLVSAHDPRPAGTVMLDHATAVAYCLPGIRPRIVISRGAMRLLESDELAAVIEHERGHANERHGLVMLPLAGLADLFRWVPYARLAPSSVAGLLEMAADDYATRHHHPHSLARALVNMATSGAAPSCAFRDRLVRGPPESAPTPRRGAIFEEDRTGGRHQRRSRTGDPALVDGRRLGLSTPRGGRASSAHFVRIRLSGTTGTLIVTDPAHLNRRVTSTVCPTLKVIVGCSSMTWS